MSQKLMERDGAVPMPEDGVDNRWSDQKQDSNYCMFPNSTNDQVDDNNYVFVSMPLNVSSV